MWSIDREAVGQDNCIRMGIKCSVMKKNKKPMHPVEITTETPTSRTGGGPTKEGKTGGGPMKEEKATRAAGGNKRQNSGDKEDSMGSGKRQDDL